MTGGTTAQMDELRADLLKKSADFAAPVQVSTCHVIHFRRHLHVVRLELSLPKARLLTSAGQSTWDVRGSSLGSQLRRQFQAVSVQLATDDGVF